MASEIRMKTKLNEKWHTTDETNIFNWLLNVTEKMEKDSFEYGLIVSWAIWNNRNAIVMNGDTRTSQRIANFATSFYQELKSAKQREHLLVNREAQK